MFALEEGAVGLRWLGKDGSLHVVEGQTKLLEYFGKGAQKSWRCSSEWAHRRHRAHCHQHIAAQWRMWGGPALSPEFVDGEESAISSPTWFWLLRGRSFPPRCRMAEMKMEKRVGAITQASVTPVWPRKGLLSFPPVRNVSDMWSWSSLSTQMDLSLPDQPTHTHTHANSVTFTPEEWGILGVLTVE